MRASDFKFVSEFVRDRSAIVLEEGKEYLVEARLDPVARDRGFGTLDALIDALRGRAPSDLADAVVEAMTTNETSFFRDVHPFAALRSEVLPTLIEQRQPLRRLKLWCGAASSGQEPYSIAMILRDVVPFAQGWSVDFVCTDIARAMLRRSESGLYTQQEVNRGLPAAELVKSFRKEGAHWRVGDDLRKMIRFEVLNLVHPLPHWRGMDIVFLRNVLIYFDQDTRMKILARVRQVMATGGYLFLGTAEATYTLESFCREQIGRAVVYRAI